MTSNGSPTVTSSGTSCGALSVLIIISMAVTTIFTFSKTFQVYEIYDLKVQTKLSDFLTKTGSSKLENYSEALRQMANEDSGIEKLVVKNSTDEKNIPEKPAKISDAELDRKMLENIYDTENDNEIITDNYKGRKPIFSGTPTVVIDISTGRSGTLALSKLLDQQSQASVSHEYKQCNEFHWPSDPRQPGEIADMQISATRRISHLQSASCSTPS